MEKSWTGSILCPAFFYALLFGLLVEKIKEKGGKKERIGSIEIVIRQIKRCLFCQIKTGLSEHLTMV